VLSTAFVGRIVGYCSQVSEMELREGTLWSACSHSGRMVALAHNGSIADDVHKRSLCGASCLVALICEAILQKFDHDFPRPTDHRARQQRDSSAQTYLGGSRRRSAGVRDREALRGARAAAIGPGSAAGPRSDAAARDVVRRAQAGAAHAAAQLVVEGDAGVDAEELAGEQVLDCVVVGARNQSLPELEARAGRALHRRDRRADRGQETLATAVLDREQDHRKAVAYARPARSEDISGNTGACSPARSRLSCARSKLSHSSTGTSPAKYIALPSLNHAGTQPTPACSRACMTSWRSVVTEIPSSLRGTAGRRMAPSYAPLAHAGVPVIATNSAAGYTTTVSGSRRIAPVSAVASSRMPATR
jgi:hypothetical protein